MLQYYQSWREIGSSRHLNPRCRSYSPPWIFRPDICPTEKCEKLFSTWKYGHQAPDTKRSPKARKLALILSSYSCLADDNRNLVDLCASRHGSGHHNANLKSSFDPKNGDKNDLSGSWCDWHSAKTSILLSLEGLEMPWKETILSTVPVGRAPLE